MQRLVLARADVLLGRLGEARRTIEAVLANALPSNLVPVVWLANAEIALREIAPTRARAALVEARRALDAAPNALLARALVALEEELVLPVARLSERGRARDADLFAIERAASGDAFLVDACRRLVIAGRASIPLARRPVLFALLLPIARAWPDSVARDELAATGFGVRVVNISHRSRLRVEIGRLRKVLHGIAEPIATKDGYALASERPVLVLVPASEDDAARVAILLGDGASWSAQSIAEHAGISKRTALRALAVLVESGRVGRTRAGKEVLYAMAGPGERIASRLLLLGLAAAT